MLTTDPYSDLSRFFSPVVNVILSSLPKADTKWKERKEVLELVLPLSQSPKITPGDFTELIKALKKVWNWSFGVCGYRYGGM